MKKIIFILAIITTAAAVFTACRSGTGRVNSESAIKYEDTVGLAQFQAWKAMNERVDPLAYQPYAPVAAPAPVTRSAYHHRSSSSGRLSSSSTNYARTTTRKKGWSKAAKYTAIGGGTGVILGAVINKRNRLAGGLVGGILLGGAGYLLGHAQDKKDGRY